MWEQLKAQEAAWVGGTLTDHDAPTEPTAIVGFELRPDWFEVQGKDFNWGGSRRYLGVVGHVEQPGVLLLHGAGMSCTIRRPNVDYSVSREEVSA